MNSGISWPPRWSLIGYAGSKCPLVSLVEPKLLRPEIGETGISALGHSARWLPELFRRSMRPRRLHRRNRRESFAHQGLWGKVLIVAAGPGFKLHSWRISFFAGWLATGAPLFVPTFPGSHPRYRSDWSRLSADTAGLQIGDRCQPEWSTAATFRPEQNSLPMPVAKSNGQAADPRDQTRRTGQNARRVTAHNRPRTTGLCTRARITTWASQENTAPRHFSHSKVLQRRKPGFKQGIMWSTSKAIRSIHGPR